MVDEQDFLPQPAFGERLKRLRQQRGLKQTDLADERGLSSSYVSRIESGRRAVTPHVAQLLAQRLGVEITAFTGNREAELARLLSDGQICLSIGDRVGAVRAFTEALGRAENAPLSLAWSLRRALITALSDLGMLSEWRQQQEALVQLAVKADAPYLLALAKHGMSNCLRLAGEIVPAYAAAREAYDLTRDHDLATDLRVQCLIALIANEVEIGRATEATRHAEELLGLLDEEVPATTRAQARWAAATTLSSRGRHREAVELITQAMDGLSNGEDLITWARLRLAAVPIRQRAGEPVPEQWRASYRQAALVLRLTAIPVYEVQLDVSEARLAAEEGRHAEAVAHCEAALDRSELLSFRDRTRTRMLAARLRAALGEWDRSLADLRAVAEELQEAGAMDLAAEAWQLIADMALARRDPS
ncbi:helix-turn-helix domain-containing protein [Micromonospora sp. DT31]|uniref:helix-turn-helix domain-containing protein n=1 Tax=Micromonospora sp. DT31 TaxID=3393434 RepID=UPI003CF0D1FA